MIFFEWLKSRKVYCVEDFPIRLNVLEDLVTVLDMESYCPVLRSIQITKLSNNQHSFDISNVKSNLSVFLSHCPNLRGVTVFVSNLDSDVVLSVLVEHLRENSLVKISLQDIETHNEINAMVANFLTKHASSLRDLSISNVDEVDMDFVVSTLIKNQMRLRKFTIIFRGEPSQALSSLISYLPLSGGLLEDLDVCSEGITFDGEDLVASVATSCPSLTRFITYDCNSCSIETLRRLYEQCLHLLDVRVGNIDRIIEVHPKSLSIEVKGHNEDWAICLSYALSRRQYKRVTLWLREDNYHSVKNLKSMLELYDIELEVFNTSESSLISILQDLPHLNEFHLFPNDNTEFTYASLAAVSKHANRLTELKIDGDYFSDKSLSKLFKACRLVERLLVVHCGWKSLQVISKLSNLTTVQLVVPAYISRELLDGLFLNEKVTWSSALKEGSIKAFGWRDSYYFDNKSHRWITCSK
eukprot:scaffold2655_cov248-Ochromonas_danica.AAC.2